MIRRTLGVWLKHLFPVYFEKRRFSQRLGYGPDLEDPKSFNEKVLWSKINNRNPLRAEVEDKTAVRDYVAQKLGSRDILVPLLFVGDDPEEVPFKDLPPEYVVKARHGSGWIEIVRKTDDPAERTLIETCREWLRKSHGGLTAPGALEWVYEDIPPQILVEPLLTDEDGDIPRDYKFFCFHGEVEMVQVDLDRFDDHRRNLYTPEWERLNAELMYPAGRDVQAPPNLDRMIEISKRLSEPFDFIRVDLYDVEGDVYFGELTNFPGSGKEPFRPQEFDFRLGAEWELKPSPTQDQNNWGRPRQR